MCNSLTTALLMFILATLISVAFIVTMVVLRHGPWFWTTKMGQRHLVDMLSVVGIGIIYGSVLIWAGCSI